MHAKRDDGCEESEKDPLGGREGSIRKKEEMRAAAIRRTEEQASENSFRQKNVPFMYVLSFSRQNTSSSCFSFK